MWNFLLDLVQVNETIDYTLIISLILSYLFLLWFIITIWVFFDAKKRYRKLLMNILIWLFIFAFGPPALIFYILVRPEHTLEEEDIMNMALSGERAMKPIHFDGNRGFEISMNFSVQPKQVASDQHKMLMNVEWSPSKGNTVQIEQKKKESGSNIQKKISSVISKGKRKVNQIKRKRKAVKMEKSKSESKQKAEKKKVSVDNEGKKRKTEKTEKGVKSSKRKSKTKNKKQEKKKKSKRGTKKSK